jgi:ferredoxin
MDSQLRSQVVFHLTGRRDEADSGADALPVGLRPALLAAYRHLESIRHDFPVVLATGGGEYVVSLSAAVDGALRAVAPQGLRGEAMRKRALQVERALRRAAMADSAGTLREQWEATVAALAAETSPQDETFVREMQAVRTALPVDGAIAACNTLLPARFVQHAWHVVQQEKALAAWHRIEASTLRLEAILRADFARSPAALQPTHLQASFAGTHQPLFDFGAMSQLLAQTALRGGLDASRRERIGWALDVLRAQEFFRAPSAQPVDHSRSGAARFLFTEVEAALDAFRRHLPDMVRLLKALQVAELEAEGQYVHELHGPVFARMDAMTLSAQDFQFFPDYLVCLSGAAPGVHAALTDALSSGMPIKVLLHVDDLLDEAAPGRGQFSFGMRGSQFAAMAVNIGDVFVLQSAASNLLQVRDRLQRGLRHAGPALFSVFAPPEPQADGLPGYLAAAAAMQSRAFPAFSYDPGAGPDLASRFSLENNPQPDKDWPSESLTYADQDLQSVTTELAFTFADYLLCDPRHADHFVAVPRANWEKGLMPAQHWLENPPHDAAAGLPYVLAVDEADLLCRLVVDEQLMRAALRCREAWRRLQELGGIHDSRAERLMAKEKLRWEQEHAAAAVASAATIAAAPAALSVPSVPEVASVVSVSAPAAEEPQRNPDEAYIETIRCSSCNECTLASPKMFAYDDNKQAYITDLKAGTYRQLVEAAESCQVSVIHPGKPWNPDEPGLEELIERAKPFL